MELTGIPLLTLLGLLAVLAPVLALVLWGRAQGPAAARAVQRFGLVLLCQLTAVLLVAVVLNDQLGPFYESWSDLFGGDQAQPAAAQADPSEAGSTSTATGTRSTGAGAAVDVPPLPSSGDRVVSEQVTGPRSRITSKIWVLLPTDYAATAASGRRYPVVVFLPGYPGVPTTWLHALQLQKVMDAEVAAKRVPPFIAVLPTMNVATPRDTECTDIPGGPQVATWLGSDVPQIIAAQTRSLPPGKGWSVTGYSTGGFCTAKIVLTHPDTYGSGAVLAGYYRATTDVTTGDLFGGNTALQQANDPLWLVAHRPTPASRLLVVWSAQDPETAGPTQAFLKAARPPLKVDEIRLAKGGHNTSVWLGALPATLRWIGAGLDAAR